jgi:hypothetical protein
MATKADIDADLTLEIDGRSVTPEKFQRGVRAFFALLNEATRAHAKPNQFVRWAVQVKSGSNLVGVVPTQFTVEPSDLDAIYASLQEGIESIEAGSEEPKALSETALRHIRELASIVGTDEGDDTKVRVWARKQPVALTHRAVANVAVLLNDAYEDFGTVEGRVQVISEQGDLHVFVAEPIRGRRIRCYFEEDMLPDFMGAFRKRVEVAGRIRYRRDGVPVSIAAKALTEFPAKEDLPSFRDMRGIFRAKA